MTVKEILDDTVGKIRCIPERLSGDDSPLADFWEEIKDQVQDELSFHWQVYIDAMIAIIKTKVISLDAEDRLTVAEELRLQPGDTEQICNRILVRLLAKARKEKVRYQAFGFAYFRYALADMTVYAKVIERTGCHKCMVEAYSGAAPFGESGEVNTTFIERVMSREEFERARTQGWPDEVD